MPHAVITYSDHARLRMKQRSLSEELVAIILNDAERIYLGGKGNMVAERGLSDGRIARVVYEDRLGPHGEHSHIITVMWK
jgi:hypothetical protein